MNFDGTYTATDLRAAARTGGADDVRRVLMRALASFKRQWPGAVMQFCFRTGDGVKWCVDVKVGVFVTHRQSFGPVLQYHNDDIGCDPRDGNGYTDGIDELVRDITQTPDALLHISAYDNE